MAIGRVAGPMLLSTLDRQGLDLNFVTDSGTGIQSLLYLDFTNFRMGVNTATTTERLTVDGNISVNAAIKTTYTNQALYLTPNGTGQVIVSNVNVLKGNINSTDIGTTTPSTAFFTTANTTGKATFTTAQVQNLTAGRITYTDGTGLTDSPNLLFFASNNTLYATNLESAGTVGYLNITITGDLKYNNGTPTYVPYFAANNMFVASPGMRYFSGNSVFRAGNIQLASVPTNRMLFTTTQGNISSTPAMTYDGSTLSYTGIAQFNGIELTAQTISGTGIDADILISPNGLGVVSVQDHRISDVPTPVLDGDAVNKRYVDERVTQSSANRIYLINSEVKVSDDGFGTANVVVTVNNTEAARFTDTYSYIGDLSVFNNRLGTVAGDLVLVPDNNNRIILDTSGSAVIPVGDTNERPAIPVTGDFRFNTEVGSPEWYTGTQWTSAAGGITAYSQMIYPNGTDSIFDLDQEASTDSILVILNGVVQQPSVAYSSTGSTLTFYETPLSTDNIEVRFLAASVVYAANPIFVNSTYSEILPPGLAGGTKVDHFNTAQYRSAIYEFTLKHVETSQYQVGQIYLIHNGVTANAVVEMKSTLGTPTTSMVNWSASIDVFGVVNLYAYDPGTLKADQITSTGVDGYVYQAVNNNTGTAGALTIGQTYTFSVWLKAVGATAGTIKLGHVADADVGYNIVSYNSSVASYTDTWARYSYTFVATTTKPAVVIGGGYSFPTGSKVLVFGAQVNVGSSPATYQTTTTTNGATNLLKYSEQITSYSYSGPNLIGWQTSAASGSLNVAIDPVTGIIYGKVHKLYFNDI
jgi:hypothetical protein